MMQEDPDRLIGPATWPALARPTRRELLREGLRLLLGVVAVLAWSLLLFVVLG